MKPEPISKYIVCSLCGMNWDEHGEKPTAEKCVELLKAEMAKRPRYQQIYHQGTSVTGGTFFAA